MNEQEWFPAVVQVAGMLLALIAGFGGIVPVVDRLKKWLNIEARWVQALTVVVVVLFTALTLIVEGALSPEAVSGGRVGIVFMTILTASQAEYQRVVRQKEKDLPNV